MPKGYVYILECADGSYYTGSTIDIEKRIAEHNDGKGANHTKKRLPVALKYIEEFQRIDDAFYREKQIQGWSRAKKEALINKQLSELKNLAECKNDSHYKLWLRLRSATEKRLRSATEKRLRSATEKRLRSATEEKNIFNNKLVAERSRSYRSNGKLLLTGEYAVLDGAKALALPTSSGQSLTVEKNNTNTIFWKSFDENDNIWFEDTLTIDDSEILEQIQGDNDIFKRLKQILKAAQELNSNFLTDNQGYTITTHLEFNRKWGLGTSSTLINNISKWASVNAYELLEKTFGGSGYDIACAQHNTPIVFQLQSQKNNPFAESVRFNPSFKDSLYFVYLNEKQNSREGIKTYKTLNKVTTSVISEINSITEAIVRSVSLSAFEELIIKHEQIIGELINETPIKSRLFSDYNGAIKSLGAWGGDFVLATSKTNPTDYFKSKGFDTIIPYNDMVL